MTLSMLFRGVGLTSVTPPFVNPEPIINIAPNAGLSASLNATVVFFSSAVFTSFFVATTVLARYHEETNSFLIALPSAIALYFANVITQLTAGGYNNPVVALIIVLQNRKYFIYNGGLMVWSGYEWAYFFGPILGGILAGLFLCYLKIALNKVKSNSGGEFV